MMIRRKSYTTSTDLDFNVNIFFKRAAVILWSVLRCNNLHYTSVCHDFLKGREVAFLVFLYIERQTWFPNRVPGFLGTLFGKLGTPFGKPGMSLILNF